MRKVAYGLVSLIIASQFLVSCSSESEILGQFSKRKYLKKYKAKELKYEERVEARENEIVYQEIRKAKEEPAYASQDKEELVYDSQKKENVFSSEQNKELKEVILVTQQEESVQHVSNSMDFEYSFWDKYNKNYKDQSFEFKEKADYATPPKSSGGAAHWTNIVGFVTGILGVPIAAFVFGAIGVLGDKPGKIFGVLGMVFAIIWIIVLLAVLI